MTKPSGHVTQRLQSIRRLIEDTATHCGRKLGCVQLLAVTKGQSIATLQEAIAADLFEFGESYLQEALPKIQALTQHPIIWHFIGPIQANKTRKIAQHFQWVHSVDRLEIAQKLNAYRPETEPPLQICLQINFDKEQSKSGIAPEEAPQLASQIAQLPRLRLRGLMMIPKFESDEQKQYHSCLRLSHLQADLIKFQSLRLDTLSMGMSHDIKPAICAGSTLVRIGRALFDPRFTSMEHLS